MERAKRILTRIAAIPDTRIHELPLLHRSLLPLLSVASDLYKLALIARRGLYLSGLLPVHRLPVPVISVGNLTWGGNGKTPMVEFIARFFDESGIPPLILTRGYSGGDEAKMLQRHLSQTSARIGVGSNRSATAALMFERYGYMDSCSSSYLERLSSSNKLGPCRTNEGIGAVILDDGMQHWRLFHNVDIVMVNGLLPWGNNHCIPRGPMRETLSALNRADIIVIHHADLVSDTELKSIESMVHSACAGLPIFFSKLQPSYVFEVKNPKTKLPLNTLNNVAVLCISAIGFPDAFVQAVWRMGPCHIDRFDFMDHHSIQAYNIAVIREKLKDLNAKFKVKAAVVLTEKDYDRDPDILKQIHEADVLVLCSSLEIMPFEGRTLKIFKAKLRKLLSERCQN